MSELAFNLQGEPFDIPSVATAWRVRRIKSKGAPEVVYGRDGLPLMLAIDADMDDLRRELGAATGRFRLDLLDESSRPIPNSSAGYVFVHPPETERIEQSETASENMPLEAMRLTTQLARGVIERFSTIMESAATLIRAGAPASTVAALTGVVREASEPDGDEEPDEDGDGTARSSVFDLNAIVSQVVTTLVTSLANGTLQIPSLEALLDWRKAAKPAQSKPARPTSEQPAESAAPRRPVTPRRASSPNEATTTSKSARSSGLNAVAQLAAIQAALSPEERALAQAMAAELAPAEQRAWLDELSALSVPEAAERVRAVMKTKEGGS